MLQFLDWSIHLADTNKLKTEKAAYLLEGLTKWSVEDFSKPLDMILQK